MCGGHDLKVLVCVTGMPGAGKSVIAKHIAEALGVGLISMGDAMRREAVRRGLGLDLESMMKFALSIRKERGEGAVAELVVKEMENMGSDVVVVDGVRSLAELNVFSRTGKVVVVAVHASPRERFRRLRSRGRRDDPSTWDEFRRRDMDELRMGLGNVIALADVMVVNEGTSETVIKEEALQRVRRALRNVLSEG
ncbi:MAG: AAA family ATPase [Desulfurococcales archaeon]|nr:AAA family ATPase [Desulfurococcales archaeon]